MSKSPASDSRPMPTSWVRISEPFSSHLQNLEEDEVNDTSLITFPTDQVPQPVTRDTIATTTMAASTDSRGSACLPQSAPTVQAQVFSTVAGCVSCDDCTHVNLNATKRHNQQAETQCTVVACDSRNSRGAEAGLPVVPVSRHPAEGGVSSVIASLSCPNSCVVSDATAKTTTLTTTTTTDKNTIYGNFNYKSNNKMQSVNVTSSTIVSINYKGNDNCLLFECNTAVTVPNTKPQRNTDGSSRASNNNSDKLDIVNVYDKNYGALNRSSTEPQQSQCRLNQIPGDDIPACDAAKPHPQKSDYLKSGKVDDENDDKNEDEVEDDDNYNYNHNHNYKRANAYVTYNDDRATISGKLNNGVMTTTTTTTTPKPISNQMFTKTNYCIDDTYIEFARLIALTKRNAELERAGFYPMRRLGLYGGGESSLSTGTSGWGTPPSANTNNNNGWGSTSSNNPNNTNNQQNWNNNQSRTNSSNQGAPNNAESNANKSNTQNANLPSQNTQPQTSQANNQGGWGPQSSKNNPGVGGGGGGGGVGGGVVGGGVGGNVGVPPTSAAAPPASGVAPAAGGPAGTPTTSTKQQLEQLNNMREALFAQDGWGGQHVNQDTNWDIPSSPEPQIKMDGSGAPQWKPTVNNGTDLWEVNLRNGGQPPPQPAQKTPWGHTPSTNIGGTWGEDDDVTDSSNVWTGVPNNQQQWGGGNGGGNSGGGGGGGGQGGGGGGGGTNGAMWGGAIKKENDWGNSGWGDPRSGDPRSAAGGIDPREMRMDPRDMRAGSNNDPMRMLDPRDQMRLVNSEMRGDPRGITGRLNGTGAEAMWGQPPQAPHHLHHQPGKMVGPGGNGAGVNQWAGPPPKDITMGGKPTGWEEPSPPSQRRNMPNYDDGTSLWGNPAQQGRVAGPSGSMGRGNGNMGIPPGMPQSRIKPDGSSVWSGTRNGSWEEGASGGAGAHAGWDESTKWADGSSSWGKTGKAAGLGTPLWDNEMDWGTHKQGPKQLTKEMIWSSKQFRLLVDMGYKKEDAENALRVREMNLEDALDLLSLQRSSMDGWRATRHDEHFDHQNNGQFPGQRFGPAGPSAQMPFPPSGNPSLLNNMNSGNAAASNNPPLTSINNMSPAIVHKMLNQSASNQGFGNNGGSGRSLQPQSQPSTQQLRMLVQQIQMAVQAGYLNHQILNQPLAPQTLLLLNQLLQQIKSLQQLMQQQQMAQNQGGSLGKPNSIVLQCSVLITKTKQQITNLQNQIAAQQAIYVKQQAHIGGGGGSATAADFFKTNMHDSINALQNNFGDLGISKDPQVSSYQNQQSRLTQWKLPALDKESEPGNEFSRAPGPVTKPLQPSHSSPNLNPLGLGQSDGPWSTGRSADTGGWPDAGPAGDSGPPDVNKDTQWPTPAPASLTDLVPEFEPGKPWKGNQIKSIEDDPSITPGSVVRSPLSIATIKDSEIFNNSAAPSKASPPGAADTIQPLSLSSSTWSFNPPTTTPSAFTRLDDVPPPTAVTSELWGVPMTKPRGPPPGLAKGSSNISLVSNGWNSSSNVGGGRGVSSWGSQGGSTGNWGSQSLWLLLRNLTAQIDGSTLRTLCMQHGPLQSFHLYLHQGFALVKYSSREEASKAQTALNNCVLGNTTMLAEALPDTDANNLLQQLAPLQSASSGPWRGSTKQQSADTWNTGWPANPNSGSLWGASPMDNADPARATPSSLNSFLPGDLLGGESM